MVSLPELAALGAFLTAIVGAVVAITKLSGERTGIRITNEQGAATIYDNLVKTLQAEVTRLNVVLAEQNAKIGELEKENDGLRQRFGTRESDSGGSVRESQ